MDRQGKHDVQDGEERAVCMCERPHQSPRAVRNVEVKTDLEPMQYLENDPQSQE